MEKANPGTIVYIDNKVYIVKKKVGLYQCWHCALQPNCDDYLAEHMFVPCFDFLIHNPINSPEAGLILRKPFKLTVENMGKHWPPHSVLEWEGQVGIVVTNHDTYKHNLSCSCTNCILFRHWCSDFHCTTDERKDRLSTIILPIETAIHFNMIQVIKTEKYND